jgi:hypothetical protein
MNFLNAVRELKENPQAIAIKVPSTVEIYIKNLNGILRVCYKSESEISSSNTFNFGIEDYLSNDFAVIYREAPKELTVEEIEKRLGYKVKVVASKGK